MNPFRVLYPALALLAVLPSPAGAAPAAAAPRLLIVSVDGLRPDVLLRAETPNMRALMARGTFTMWARTTEASVTLPSHVSMLTGVRPERHGVTWNDDRHNSDPVYPKVPTLFDLARRAGFTTAMVAGKAKFIALEKPGTLDWSHSPRRSTLGDSAVTDTAVRWIAAYAPQVMFVHLPSPDFTGHDHGWGSELQMAAVAGADRCVGRLLAALAARGVLDSTVVIVSADHGGADHSHGRGDPRSRTIPWIVTGPGIRADLDLASTTKDDVDTEDTFATACALLGLRPPPGLDGQPVARAFAGP